jgi:hypothetical protein
MSADLTLVPAEMKAERRWVTWEDEDGKKVPSGRSGHAGWQLPENRFTFDEAVKRGPNVGIVLGGGLSGMDLDGCIDPATGKLNELAEDILYDKRVTGQDDSVEPKVYATDEGFGCYAEISPSGTGLKIFGRSNLPGIEMHFNGGAPKVTKTFPPDASYFAVTGNAINAAGLRDLTEALGFFGSQPQDTKRKAEPLAPAIGEGTRNPTLFTEGSRLRGLGFAESEIKAALSAINKNRCDPALSEKEVADIAARCAKYDDGTALFEEQVARAVNSERIRREARHRLDLEERGPIEPP